VENKVEAVKVRDKVDCVSLTVEDLVVAVVALVPALAVDGVVLEQCVSFGVQEDNSQ
jgi:hypothetical protein